MTSNEMLGKDKITGNYITEIEKCLVFKNPTSGPHIPFAL